MLVAQESNRKEINQEVQGSIWGLSRQEDTRKEVGPLFPGLMAGEFSGAINLYLYTYEPVVFFSVQQIN